MNRPILMMTLLGFELFMTFVAQSVALTVNQSINIGISAFDLTLGGMLNMVGFWFNMMAFQVQGIPAVIVLFVFYPINIAIAVIIAEMVRGN